MKSMKRILLVGASLAVVAALTGCGKDVSFDTLEQARGQARDNAMWNAQKWRADSGGMYSAAEIIGRGDSSQMPDCPQGDGWATLDLFVDKKKAVTLKCSTVSMNVGCLESNDFKTKAYAVEDGKCQPTTKVPFPLPKVGGK
jgi:hypothetical protein